MTAQKPFTDRPNTPQNPRIVCKFGGSSLADASQFQKVAAIVNADPRRRVIVPSAPGRRSPEDAKITDLLYLCQKSAAIGTDFQTPFALIRDRFLAIQDELQIDAGIADELLALQDKLRRGVSPDFAASRGEYLNGRILATYLNATFIDPAEHLEITAFGEIAPHSYAKLAAAMKDGPDGPDSPVRADNLDRPDANGALPRYVMPGFFGRDRDGQVKTFSRGGSDISGAIAARAIKAQAYENWTDVSGLLMADPRIVDQPRSMAEVTYAEIRELSYMGASVLHDEAIAPVREIGIPIHIKNTNRPEDPGTRIVASLSEEEHQSTEIAGIAGTCNFSMISVQKNLMNKEIGFGYRLLGVLERHRISFEHCPSSIDSMSVVCHRDQFKDKLELVLEEINSSCRPDELVYVPRIALIAVVGEGMAKTIGIAAKVFASLRDAGVNVILINQGASELNIIVGVDPEDYKSAVQTLYRAFVPGRPPN